MNLRLDADQHYLTPASFSEDVKVSLVDFSQSDNDISTPDDVTIEVDDVTQNIPDNVMIYGPSLTEDSRVTIVAKIEGAPRPDVAWSLDNKVCCQFYSEFLVKFIQRNIENIKIWRYNSPVNNYFQPNRPLLLQVLEPGDKYLITPLNSTHYTLTITSFSEDDVGSYSCSATNTISSDTQTVVVNVESKF